MEENERGTYAGLWIQHRPDFRVVARFTQGGEQTVGPYVEGGPLEGLVGVAPASATLAELRATQQAATRTVSGAGVRTDALVDVRENRVELRVLDRERLGAALRRANVRLPDEEVTVAEVPELPDLQADVYAGLPLYRPGPSGYVCTSGFSVKNSTAEGVTTAAHCSGAETGASLGLQYPSGNDLPRKYRLYEGSHDVEWHTTPGYDDRAWYNSGGGNHREVQGLCGRTCVQVNSYVCHYGQTTDHECGYVFDTASFGAQTIPNRNNTFVHVYKRKPSSALSLGGDSGGPWFAGTTAFGIHHGGYEDADFWYSVYMPINYVSGLNVSVQTTN